MLRWKFLSLYTVLVALASLTCLTQPALAQLPSSQVHWTDSSTSPLSVPFRTRFEALSRDFKDRDLVRCVKHLVSAEEVCEITDR